MLIYFKCLAVCFACGGFVHVLDLLDLRLKLSQMKKWWRVWFAYSVIVDFLVAYALWFDLVWRFPFLLFTIFTQLYVYDRFGHLLQEQAKNIRYTMLFHFFNVLIVGVYLLIQSNLLTNIYGDT